MSKLGTIALQGKDGHKYEFSVFPLDAHFKESHGGVYVVTHRHDEPHSHHGSHIIFIGETDDLFTALKDHPKQADFDKEEANAVCVHATQDQQARARICKALSEHYTPDAG